MGLTGKFFEQGEDGIDSLAAPCQFGEGDARRYAEQAAAQFLNEYGNLLSSYSLQGEFGLWATLQTYIQAMGLGDAVSKAVEDGDVAAYSRGIFNSQVNAFAVLFQRGALERLQLVERLPDLAAEELTKLLKYASARSSAAAPVAKAEPAVVVFTPTEQCAQDFQDLGSAAFKTKYLTNQNGGKIYEQALAEGKIS